MPSALLSLFKTKAMGGVGAVVLIILGLMWFRLWAAGNKIESVEKENLDLLVKVEQCNGLIENRDAVITKLTLAKNNLTVSVQKQNEIIEGWKDQAAKLEQERNKEAARRVAINKKMDRQITREHRRKSGAKALTEYFRGLL